jgi:hypothetical protein
MRFAAMKANTPAGRRHVGARARNNHHGALDPNAKLRLGDPGGFGSAESPGTSAQRANKFIRRFISGWYLCGLGARRIGHVLLSLAGAVLLGEDRAARFGSRAALHLKPIMTSRAPGRINSKPTQTYAPTFRPLGRRAPCGPAH